MKLWCGKDFSLTTGSLLSVCLLHFSVCLSVCASRVDAKEAVVKKELAAAKVQSGEEGLSHDGVSSKESPRSGDGAKDVKVKKIQRKTQSVNFDGSDIDGMVRSPDGSYLLQKRGVGFMPLYQVKKQMDKNIKDSVESLR